MEIKKEDFEKLNQLDRIEYRQKYRNIKDRFDGSACVAFVNAIMPIFAFLFIVDIWMFERTGRHFELAMFSSIAQVVIEAIVLLAVLDFVLIYMEKKRYRELNEEYFKIITKKEKK